MKGAYVIYYICAEITMQIETATFELVVWKMCAIHVTVFNWLWLQSHLLDLLLHLYIGSLCLNSSK